MKVVTDSVLLDRLMALYGWRRTGFILGWATMAGMTAPKGADRAWLLHHGPMSQATRYRVVGYLEEVRDSLRADGYVFEDPEPAGPVGVVIEALA